MPQSYYLDLVSAKACPADRPYDNGIVTIGGKAKPFLVVRSWSGPSGVYNEQWSLRRGGKDVIHRGPMRQLSVRGMQSVTERTDRVSESITLEPGTYQLVFVVEGRFMGSVPIDVRTIEPATL
jgi:hypothetical protein